jgi:hypothetical protein
VSRGEGSHEVEFLFPVIFYYVSKSTLGFVLWFKVVQRYDVANRPTSTGKIY